MTCKKPIHLDSNRYLIGKRLVNEGMKFCTSAMSESGGLVFIQGVIVPLTSCNFLWRIKMIFSKLSKLIINN